MKVPMFAAVLILIAANTAMAWDKHFDSVDDALKSKMEEVNNSAKPAQFNNLVKARKNVSAAWSARSSETGISQ